MTREGSKARRILITGPVRSLDEWTAAAQRAGFEAIESPLVRIEERELDSDAISADVAAICITSANALPPLARLAAERPELTTIPMRCVGTRTAERARELGFAVAREAAEDAASLAAQMRRGGATRRSVLWPRGSRSRELHVSLSEAGFDVHDPVAYASIDALPTEALPDAQVVFFASPSAVRVFLAARRLRALEATVAVAIGSTTAAALQGQPFLALASLPHPAPDALTWRLDHLGFDLPA